MTVQPRPWIEVDDLVSEDDTGVLCPLPDSVTDLAAEAAIEIATAVLYERTGRRWHGVQEQSFRPSAQDPDDNFLIPNWVESWGTLPCSPSDTIDFPVFPVKSVVEVRVDGTVVPSSAYQLQDSRRLVRVDGSDWPCSQDLSLPATQLGTFEVKLVHGVEPPEAGKYCCAVYAAELAKAFCNLDCALPQRTQYVTRQGVSALVMDPLNVIFRGMVGLPTVDSWIRSVNPHGRRKRSLVVSGRTVAPEGSEDACWPPSLPYGTYGHPRRGVNRFG